MQPSLLSQPERVKNLNKQIDSALDGEYQAANEFVEWLHANLPEAKAQEGTQLLIDLMRAADKKTLLFSKQCAWLRWIVQALHYKLKGRFVETADSNG